jgi:hypothetical protein
MLLGVLEQSGYAIHWAPTVATVVMKELAVPRDEEEDDRLVLECGCSFSGDSEDDNAHDGEDGEDESDRVRKNKSLTSFTKAIMRWVSVSIFLLYYILLHVIIYYSFYY